MKNRIALIASAMLAGLGALSYNMVIPKTGSNTKPRYRNKRNETAFTKGKRNKSLKSRSNRRK